LRNHEKGGDTHITTLYATFGKRGEGAVSRAAGREVFPKRRRSWSITGRKKSYFAEVGERGS